MLKKLEETMKLMIRLAVAPIAMPATSWFSGRSECRAG
jgi:hypothetical protein